MVLPIILTVIITAVITAILVIRWSASARGQGDASAHVATLFLIRETGLMAKELGYEDMYQYWLAKYGKEYAETGATNIKNAINYINSR
jgi:hypothetical protein